MKIFTGLTLIISLSIGIGVAGTLAFQATDWTPSDPFPNRDPYPKLMGGTYDSPLERAIHLVESSGRLTSGEPLIGSYNERGPLQVTYAAWLDAMEHDPTIGGTYDMVDDLQYSLHIFRAYMDRYATQRRGVYNDYQRAAIWNGGPRGHHKEATRKYSERVVALLQGGEL